MSESLELLPCPFCGGEASPDGVVRYSEVSVARGDVGQAEYYFCNCIKCGVSNEGITGHLSRAKAIEAWNRRAAISKATGEPVEMREAS